MVFMKNYCKKLDILESRACRNELAKEIFRSRTSAIVGVRSGRRVEYPNLNDYCTSLDPQVKRIYFVS